MTTTRVLIEFTPENLKKIDIIKLKLVRRGRPYLLNCICTAVLDRILEEMDEKRVIDLKGLSVRL